MSEERIVSSSRVIKADAAAIFELIADPAQHPTWDGNDNTAEAQNAERITDKGQTFVMLNTSNKVRDNQVTEFDEGRLIAWMPGPVGATRPGHLWRWELEPVEGGTRVTHTYDWTKLIDESRFERARSTKEENLAASIDRLAALVEK